MPRGVVPSIKIKAATKRHVDPILVFIDPSVYYVHNDFIYRRENKKEANERIRHGQLRLFGLFGRGGRRVVCRRRGGALLGRGGRLGKETKLFAFFPTIPFLKGLP